MHSFRATRYDPKLRNASGAFIPKTWTSSSDIGRTFEGEQLSVATYIAAEDAYVAFALALFDWSRVTTLKCTGLEDHGPVTRGLDLPHAAEVASITRELHEGCELDRTRVGLTVRAALRELTWCRLSGPGGVFIHFGHDLYMFAGSYADLDLHVIDIPLLFVEPFDSPDW